VSGRKSPIRKRRIVRYIVAAAILAAALTYGRTRAAPDLEPLIESIYPTAASTQQNQNVYHVYDTDGRLIGWAGLGQSGGYGGPMSLLVGVDTTGTVVGVRVVEQRETPVFWSRARVPDYFRAITGARYDEVGYDYQDIAAVTGATLSTDAVIESVRTSIADVAGVAFDVHMPLPRKPFEFGLLEIVILALFAVGIASRRLRGPKRSRVRWGAQITGLVVLGFWKESPITLTKITAILSGYLPDVRTSIAIYLLLAGFFLTTILYGRNLYCLYACPFGAAQRIVGVIGGRRLKLPPWSVRAMETARNIVVFGAMFAAFLTLQPALTGYEPFAVLFSLRGTNLQWLLLFIVLVASLAIRTPWCAFFCPMRTIEVAIQDTKRWVRRKRREAAT